MISPLINSLLADGPASGLEKEMDLYGRLCGRWKTLITYFPLDGPEHRGTGEWTFGYALEGRAVIDVWEVPPRAQLARSNRDMSRECGLCVRIYDPTLKLWRFTFHGPINQVTINMLAFPVGPDIVQERYVSGNCERWIFSDMSLNRFSWRSIHSSDGGATWRLMQTIEASRAI
jgi:hypothetical protein